MKLILRGLVLAAPPPGVAQDDEITSFALKANF
jgi:hypothetical protein